MYTHNLNPVLFNLGFVDIRWYSLAYVFGIIFAWWFGKRIILKKFEFIENKFEISKFDDLITYLIISIIIGGRIGYVIFYNFQFFFENPFEIFKIWQGGMSFHGALLGIIIGTLIFTFKEKIQSLFLLDIIACVAPVGIFLGRIANFINGELVGKVSNVPWSVIFPEIDNLPRHPSQLYEAFLEGIVLFIILNKFINKKNYKIGHCSILFLIFYGTFRIFAELFREPDIQIGYIFNFLSMGSLLSIVMILSGIIIFFIKKDENRL